MEEGVSRSEGIHPFEERRRGKAGDHERLGPEQAGVVAAGAEGGEGQVGAGREERLEDPRVVDPTRELPNQERSQAALAPIATNAEEVDEHAVVTLAIDAEDAGRGADEAGERATGGAQAEVPRPPPAAGRKGPAEEGGVVLEAHRAVGGLDVMVAQERVQLGEGGGTLWIAFFPEEALGQRASGRSHGPDVVLQGDRLVAPKYGFTTMHQASLGSRGWGWQAESSASVACGVGPPDIG